MLEVRNLSYTIASKLILDNVSLKFYPGCFNMILGPNGSGKSTFLKLICGELKVGLGAIFYGNKDIKTLVLKDLAKQRAVMSQQADLTFPLSVYEVVMMGRYPHFTFNPTGQDKKICMDALRLLNLHQMADRDYIGLSGGEKQRVQFARVLAQIWYSGSNGQRYLFLDEPLNNLDIRFQQQFLNITRSFIDDATTVVAVMHDINLAAVYADTLCFFKNGKIIKSGSTDQLLNANLLEDVFEIKGRMLQDDITGKKIWFSDDAG